MDLTDQFNKNEAVIAYILHYCKFLFNLYTVLETDNNVPDNHLLKVEIANKILNNYTEIEKFISGKPNKFGFIAALKEFSHTEHYHKIKKITKVHSSFFSQKFNFIK